MQSPGAVVLIVEDDRALAATLRQQLERAGYTVETAADGAAGLARIRRGGLDVVLLDLRLPKLDGLELCRRVRARKASVCLPIIILTAMVEEEQRRAAFAAGANDYLTKPSQRAELLDRVRVWVRTRQRLQAAHKQLRRDLAKRERAEAALREARVKESRLEGVQLTARQLAHRLRNDLALAMGELELLQQELPAELQAPLDVLMGRLRRAVDHVDQFQHVVRVETWETPLGPALDLERSVAPDRAATESGHSDSASW
jgi:DNA-binding response OmpR family regulator